MNKVNLSLNYFLLKSTCFKLSLDSIKALYKYLARNNQDITLDSFSKSIEYTYDQLQDDYDYLICYNKPKDIIKVNIDCYLCIY